MGLVKHAFVVWRLGCGLGARGWACGWRTVVQRARSRPRLRMRTSVVRVR